MAAQEVDLHNIEIQLMPFFFELSMLKFRVEEACPEVRAKYRDLVIALSSQYNFVQTQVRKLREMENDALEEQLTVTRHNLEELQEKFNTVGQWIYLETANHVSSYY
jgi:predicted nuclease with TOPRIM domain